MEIEKMEYLVSGHENKISALLSDMITLNKRMSAAEKLGAERTARMRARNYELLKRIEALEGRVYKCSPVGFPCGDMDCDDCSHSPKHDDDCAWHSSFDPMDVEPGPMDDDYYEVCRNNDCIECRNSDENGGKCEAEQVFERVDTPKPCADREVVVFKRVSETSCVTGAEDYKYDMYLAPLKLGMSHVPWDARIEDARKFRTMPEATAYAVEHGLGDVSFRFVDAVVEADDRVIDVGDLVTRTGSGVDRWVVLRTVSQGNGDKELDVLCIIGNPDSVWKAGDSSIESRCWFALVAMAGEWGS